MHGDTKGSDDVVADDMKFWRSGVRAAILGSAAIYLLLAWAVSSACEDLPAPDTTIKQIRVETV